MTIVVTGAAGFIGSNLIHALNARGETNIVAVDRLDETDRFLNLTGCDVADYQDKDEFLEWLWRDDTEPPRAIFHQGACSDTMERDGRFMMDNNYRYSMDLLAYCHQEGVPLIYASSASVYGNGPHFVEERRCESPLNVYAYSKFQFDQAVRQRWHDWDCQVVGLRYFNVYGPREGHKGRMASVAWHHHLQWQAEGRVRLFEGSDGDGPGEQRRDFVSVDDVVKVNLHFLDNPNRSGIFNVGTGTAQSFNDLALATLNAHRVAAGQAALPLADAVAAGLLAYIPFPDALRGKYQSYTQADLTQLRSVGGYAGTFMDVAQGVADYQAFLQSGKR